MTQWNLLLLAVHLASSLFNYDLTQSLWMTSGSLTLHTVNATVIVRRHEIVEFVMKRGNLVFICKEEELDK